MQIAHDWRPKSRGLRLDASKSGTNSDAVTFNDKPIRPAATRPCMLLHPPAAIAQQEPAYAHLSLPARPRSSPARSFNRSRARRVGSARSSMPVPRSCRRSVVQSSSPSPPSAACHIRPPAPRRKRALKRIGLDRRRCHSARQIMESVQPRWCSLGIRPVSSSSSRAAARRRGHAPALRWCFSAAGCFRVDRISGVASADCPGRHGRRARRETPDGWA